MARKYKVKKYKRADGFRSGLESLLASKIPKDVKWGFESERIPYVLPKKYIPDFIITKANGTKMYIEAKGYLRYEDQQKMRSVKHCNPDLDIRFFFGNDKKVHGSTMTNSQWCEKYDFKYAIGKIPKQWWR